MSDYQGKLKLTLEGLDKLRQLDDRLESIESRADSVRQAIAGIGDALKTNLDRQNTAFRNLIDTRQERLSAGGSIRSTSQRRSAQGRFLQGPSVESRRLANARLQAAKVDTQNAQLELGRALQERQEIIKSGVIERRRRLQQRTLPSLVLGGERVAGKRERTLRGVTESASGVNQQLRLGGIDAEYQRRLQAFRRGGGGTNAPELIQKVFEITQAYAAQKRIISATGDTTTRVTRKQAAELGALSATLVKYNEAQLERNRLARGRVEKASAARRLGDRLRPLEAASGTARDPKTGELLYPNVTRPAFPRKQVERARELVNRAADAAQSGDQELFRLASFQAKKIIDRLEAGAKAGLKGAPSSPVRGSVNIADSPAYMDRLARLGGPRESIRGRKNLGGSPAAVTEGTRRLNAARKAAENAALKRVAIQAALDSRAFDDKLKESDSLARKEINQIKIEGKEAGKTFGQRLQNRAKARRLEAKGQKDLSAATQAAQGATAKAITTQTTLEGRSFDDKLKESNTLARQEIKRAKADNRDAGRDFSQRLQNRAKAKQLEAKGLENLSAATKTAQSASTSAAVTQAGINAKPFDDRLKASAEATRKEAKQFDTQGKEAGKAFEQRLQNRVDAGKNLGAATQAAQVAATKTAAVQAALDDKTFKNKLDKINQLAKAELKQIKDSDKADLKAFDDRLKNRTVKKRQDKQNAFFQGDARSAIGDALIGGAFPALFGQGFGASAGGALGGGLGGALGGSFGFGLSLVGTAVGQAIDTTAKNLTDLASALKTPGDTMEALAKSGFHVSNSLKFQVQQLESVGRAYDAQTLVLQEVEKRLGPG